jgi:hypothetical protein
MGHEPNRRAYIAVSRVDLPMFRALTGAANHLIASIVTPSIVTPNIVTR